MRLKFASLTVIGLGLGLNISLAFAATGNWIDFDLDLNTASHRNAGGSTDLVGQSTPRKVERHLYVGPAISRLSPGGDFDGQRILFTPDFDKFAAVPHFDSALGFGGVAGMRGPLTSANIDLALELSYQQGAMRNTFVNEPNTDKAVLHEFGWTVKAYFLPERSLQPFLAAGFDIPWLTVPGGEINARTLNIDDETFVGMGGHGGAGLCYFISPELSLEGSLLYHYRHFTSLNGMRIDNPLNSGSWEPMLSVQYHFGARAPASAPNPRLSSPKFEPSPDSVGKDPNIL